MSTLEMDPVFTAALREALISNAISIPQAKRRWRWRFGAGMFVTLSIAAGGVALATGLFSQPGAPIDLPHGGLVRFSQRFEHDVQRGRSKPTISSTLGERSRAN